MKSYGQFCPIAKAAEIFCERWTALIIRNLAAGAHRFTDIHRGVPLMSSTLLSHRLKQLEAEGVIARHRPDGAQYWEYHLTESGAEFVPILAVLGTWGRRWTRRMLEPGELDLGLLVWGLEHCVDAAALGPGRHVVLLTFSDVPDHKSRHWFVCDSGVLDYCVTDPGFAVDLYLTATLKDMTHIYRGDVAVKAALDAGQLEVIGPRRLVSRLRAWLNLGPLAQVPPADQAA